MARKKKSKIPPFVIKSVFAVLFVTAIGFGITRGLMYFFRNTEYFRIQSIVVDPSLQFINKRDLKDLLGKNIFKIDLKAVQRRLSYKYPQASDLKVIKRFPNQVAIVAKQRLPFVQMQINNQIAILDEEGVVLSLGQKMDKGLPRITGSWTDDRRVIQGLPFTGTDVAVALEIANLFQANKSLSPYQIDTISVENLSKINCVLSNDLKIFLDRNNIAQRIRVLGVVLSQGKLDLRDIKYIDLRFKEPIIGKK